MTSDRIEAYLCVGPENKMYQVFAYGPQPNSVLVRSKEALPFREAGGFSTVSGINMVCHVGISSRVETPDGFFWETILYRNESPLAAVALLCEEGLA